MANALKDMAAGLEGYGTVVTDLYKNVTEVDDNAQADLARKAVAGRRVRGADVRGPQHVHAARHELGG